MNEQFLNEESCFDNKSMKNINLSSNQGNAHFKKVTFLFHQIGKNSRKLTTPRVGYNEGTVIT